jgi:hypothetical protein
MQISERGQRLICAGCHITGLYRGNRYPHVQQGQGKLQHCAEAIKQRRMSTSSCNCGLRYPSIQDTTSKQPSRSVKRGSDEAPFSRSWLHANLLVFGHVAFVIWGGAVVGCISGQRRARSAESFLIKLGEKIMEKQRRRGRYLSEPR